MFTGIVTHAGTVAGKGPDNILIREPDLASRVRAGDSISVNGICLTVARASEDCFAFFFMPETEARTTIGAWQEGDRVNLELPVGAAGLFAGHIVTGHVDGVGKVKKIFPAGGSRKMEITVPTHLAKYIASKGSIAVNGVSLTVIETAADFFTVGLIPYTMEHTMFGLAAEGDALNIEVDILAKYLERLTRP